MGWTNLRRAVAVSALTLLTTAGAVGATPTTGTIIEGRGIAGVELGASQAQAEAVLGAPDRCYADATNGTNNCAWFASESDFTSSIGILFKDPAEPTRTAAKPRRRAPAPAPTLPSGAVSITVSIPGFVTTAGIGINASGDDLRAAYGASLVQCVFNLCLPEVDGDGRGVTTTFDMGYRGLQGVSGTTVSYNRIF